MIGWGTTLAIKTLVVLAIIPLGALILGYTFLLKMMSHMQSRLGPMDPGGFHGWFQLVGDGMKFLQKEDIMPAEADRRVFALAPAVVVLSTFLVFLVIPTGPRLVVKDLDVGVFYALAVSSLSVIGVLMAGWASANKFALLGALRAAAQLIAYELPLLLAVVGVVMQAGTMNLQGIVLAQQNGSIFGVDWIGNPYILTQFVGFFLFLVAAQAELTQTPFDMPVAESELVAGYMVEYTGFRFLFFFIGEFGTAFAFAALAATLFLGGWAIPGVHGGMADLLGPFVLFAKLMAVAFLMFWVRFTYPRLREDQLQALAWKFLIPLALAQHRRDRHPQGGAVAMARPKIPGVISGLGVTFRTMLEGAVTVQYPHEKEDLPPRARGVIALKEENCTVCMLCARQCPDWCIYIEGHKEQRPPRREGGQAAHGQHPRPLRHRLRALHVLRDLCRGVPVRRALLEPRVRVLRAQHRQAAPRQGEARRVDGDGARARAARARRGSQG